MKIFCFPIIFKEYMSQLRIRTRDSDDLRANIVATFKVVCTERNVMDARFFFL